MSVLCLQLVSSAPKWPRIASLQALRSEPTGFVNYFLEPNLARREAACTQTRVVPGLRWRHFGCDLALLSVPAFFVSCHQFLILCNTPGKLLTNYTEFDDSAGNVCAGIGFIFLYSDDPSSLWLFLRWTSSSFKLSSCSSRFSFLFSGLNLSRSPSNQ